MRILDMESPFTTDAITSCSIEIDPGEFPLLLSGRDYTIKPFRGTSHSIPVVEPVGPVFEVTTSFSASHVGEVVSIFTGDSRRRAIIHYYKE